MCKQDNPSDGAFGSGGVYPSLPFLCRVELVYCLCAVYGLEYAPRGVLYAACAPSIPTLRMAQVPHPPQLHAPTRLCRAPNPLNSFALGLARGYRLLLRRQACGLGRLFSQFGFARGCLLPSNALGTSLLCYPRGLVKGDAADGLLRILPLEGRRKHKGQAHQNCFRGRPSLELQHRLHVVHKACLPRCDKCASVRAFADNTRTYSPCATTSKARMTRNIHHHRGTISVAAMRRGTLRRAPRQFLSPPPG